MKRNILNSPRLAELKKHRRNIFLTKILLFFVATFGTFFLLAYISQLPQLNISNIEISGNKVVATETIKAIVEEKIKGDYLQFFPKRNILLYPKNNIKKEILDQFKRIKKVGLAIKENKILEISVNERVALYTWCRENPSQQEGGAKEECYFLDDSGYIFDKAPYFSGEIYFKFYGSITSDEETPLGIYFSPTNFTKFVLFKGKLEDAGLKPTKLQTQDGGDVHIHLSNKTSAQEPKILFKISSNVETLAENLEAALNTEPFLSEFKNKYSSLEYIDLRFGNKVYYKFR